jgi:hypothetical protein
LRRQRSTVFARQIDSDKDRVRSQLGAKTQARLDLCATDLYLTGRPVFPQVLGSQGLVFDK